ncbi:hypothetical protein LguiB_017772 [Lonicera macranthoides]
MKVDRLVEILDDLLVKEANIEQLNEVSMLIKRCLRVNGEERPTMKEVVVKLEICLIGAGVVMIMGARSKWSQVRYLRRAIVGGIVGGKSTIALLSVVNPEGIFGVQMDDDLYGGGGGGGGGHGSK